jgi:hypothetical protein
MGAEERWSDLDEILHETAAGNSAGIFAMIEDVYGPPVADSAPADHDDANYVINCNDSDLGPTDAQVRSQARAMAHDFPLFGAHTAFNLFACKTWQPQRSVLEPPVAPSRTGCWSLGPSTTQPPRTPAPSPSPRSLAMPRC